MPERGAPLAVGSISLRLYPHDGSPADVVRELMAQSRLAEAAGFDGVMTSEHHGGFPNYLPNPLLAAAWALEATERIWAAPCPMLLPLRPVAQVVEDLAWTAARFPGRVGAGFAAGALEPDFALAEVPFDEMLPRFKAALPVVVAGLRGHADDPLAADPAVAALRGVPVPVVSAAQSPGAARRSAGLGIGLLFDSLIGTERAARVLSQVHADGGGEGARILIRRVWVGEPPASSVAAQMDRYRNQSSAGVQRHWSDGDGMVASTDPTEVVDRLVALLAATGTDALNLRVFQAGLRGDEVRRQIERLGHDVVGPLRARLLAGDRPPSAH